MLHGVWHTDADSQELFSKLRFSYLEQVTKERFIRDIVSDPPLLVEHQDNIDLEAQLSVAKAELKAQKTEVADMVAGLERRGRELSRKHDAIAMRTVELRALPQQIEQLQASIAQLRETQAPGTNPLVTMPLDQTRTAAAAKRDEQADLERQIKQLQATLPGKERELQRLEAEQQSLETRKVASRAAAEEAQRRKQAALNGVGSSMEERGRWWRSVDVALRGMLGVDAA
jgi:chromosome segregation ATPase